MKRIILIDDDVDFNESLREYLEYEGFSVTSAYDGREGLKLIYENEPDLIITDIVMPNVEGIELLNTLTRQPLSTPVKIIAISGGGRVRGESYLELASSFNVDKVFEKPFVLEKFVTEIKALLN